MFFQTHAYESTINSYFSVIMMELHYYINILLISINNHKYIRQITKQAFCHNQIKQAFQALKRLDSINKPY